MARDRTKLADAEVQGWLKAHPGWALEGGMIRRTFAFEDFRGAMAFVNRVADAAEAADHHPDIDIRYSKVTLALVTHDAGGLTSRDIKLGEAADTLAAT
ncbi:MAG TPA: 4a-hydroxytetrahydrobiopterin dehydratase [Myxococcaceae bacterium]|nr:4a-hydroxytetrahydrobiopterin dehydratase [Myxococcaceae bacterium]